MVRGSTPCGARLPSSIQTGPGAHPSSQTLGTGPLPHINLLRRGVTHPPPSRAEVKKRVELHLHNLLSALMAVYVVKFT